ncbi:MAG: PhnD/SsuA/transferrin family substrate-binding protein [Actinomycetota bacterium]
MTGPGVLRFATFLAPSMEPVYAWIVEAAAAQLGRTGELHVGSEYAELSDGRADAAFLCGLPFVRLAAAPSPTVTAIAAPVLAGERYAGRPIYFSDVIVASKSPFRSFGDLRGASWAFNETDSQSGFGVVRSHLAAIGETRAFFGRIVEAGFHHVAIRLVAEGAVDGAAIDSQVLAIALRDEPGLAERLRVIEALGPSTIQPVVASADMPSAERRALQEALVGLAARPGGREALGRGFVDRFVPIDDADYDDIRHMEAAADATGLAGLGTLPESLARGSIFAPERPTSHA